MTEQDILTYWTVGLVVATALAALSAALLIRTMRTAHEIEQKSGAVVEVIKRIRAQTEFGSETQQANQAIQELNTLAESLLLRARKAVQAQPAVKIPNGKVPRGGLT